MPLAGGTTIPTVAGRDPAQRPLPGRAQPGAGSSNVLYRVNAGRPGAAGVDSGPDWSSDAGFVSGGSTADWGASVPLDAHRARPAPRPAIFTTERYGAQDWNFPVAGGNVGHGAALLRQPVRRHRRSRAARLRRPRRRRTDRARRLRHRRGSGRTSGHHASFPVTSDGNVDIDFCATSSRTRWSTASRSSTRRRCADAPRRASSCARPVDASGSPDRRCHTANTAIDWSTRPRRVPAQRHALLRPRATAGSTRARSTRRPGRSARRRRSTSTTTPTTAGASRSPSRT